MVVAAIYAALFYFFGKDDPIMHLVEYHAPKDVSSAEVGVIIDEEVNDSDIISLILDWGRRGIITIEETDDDLILTKVNNLEKEAKNFERILFKGLFNKKTKVVVSTLKDSFYKIIGNAKDSLHKYYNKERTRLSTSTSIAIQITCSIFSFVPYLFSFILVEWKCNHRLAILGPGIFVSVGIVIASFLLNYLHKKRFVMEWWKKLLIGLFILNSFISSTLLLATVFFKQR